MLQLEGLRAQAAQAPPRPPVNPLARPPACLSIRPSLPPRRECPLCFHSLQLKDPDLNALLPFGEYVSPQQAAAQAASLESWDLERLLVQLAAANQRAERRAAREARHRLRRLAAGGGEPSAPQPIRGDAASARRCGAGRGRAGCVTVTVRRGRCVGVT